MTHVALFNNLLSKEFLSMEESGHPDVIPSALYIQCGLETPYMMHQLLAASALHLSIKTPESRGHYREYATGLQTRALSLFNQSNPILEVTSSNCVQMFMFSSMIGVHLLCDTLYYQRDSLEGFVDSFTHCLAANRGILTVIDQSRNLLHETELGPHLRLPEVLMQSTDGSGSECAALWDLANAADITPSARKAYRDAIFYLQRLFDAQQSSSGDRTRMPMVFVWQAIVPLDYVGLLRQRQPIALVILAHYAVLLHRGRGLWLIGQGGRFLIESIYGSLPDWQPWLKFPITALRDESTAT
ncbi:Uu.00g040380.m01.CDS01 [Anthostomella pinea]|uniref:Uu.00g040380.m01.CDS01 n=1 Tax=Anthostomella pinea TaxID=933095 RepID=A0AAI8VA71_9PEZI|nr:Uu.00g040380.m01.CDS01 [Anthostomella pinea]